MMERVTVSETLRIHSHLDADDYLLAVKAPKILRNYFNLVTPVSRDSS
jgi:hypothetical protein